MNYENSWHAPSKHSRKISQIKDLSFWWRRGSRRANIAATVTISLMERQLLMTAYSQTQSSLGSDKDVRQTTTKPTSTLHVQNPYIQINNSSINRITSLKYHEVIIPDKRADLHRTYQKKNERKNLGRIKFFAYSRHTRLYSTGKSLTRHIFIPCSMHNQTTPKFGRNCSLRLITSSPDTLPH